MLEKYLCPHLCSSGSVCASLAWNFCGSRRATACHHQRGAVTMLVVTTSTPRPANAFPQLWASSDQCDMTGTGPTSAMRQTRVLALNLCKSGPRLFGSWLFLGELWLSCSACFDMRAAAATVAGNHVDNRSSQPTANMPSKGNEGQLPAATMTRPVLSAWRASTTCQTKCDPIVPTSLKAA